MVYNAIIDTAGLECQVKSLKRLYKKRVHALSNAGTFAYNGYMLGFSNIFWENQNGFGHRKRGKAMESRHGDEERLQKQLKFILEIDKEKNIFRQTHLSGHGRNENDAEHAWHMAVMAYLLQEYANEKIDIAKTMLMCLIHDIVEIDAGDTYAYDEEGKKTQKMREEKAADRIFGLLPEEQNITLRGIFEEFTQNRTAEAKFAHAMDNLQPLLLNDSNDGADWVEHGVRASQVRNRQGKTAEGSEILYEYTDTLLKKHEQLGHFREESREVSRESSGHFQKESE